MARRTRIVATLGPATDRPGVLEKMLQAGLDVVRINFSHGSAADHRGRIARVRELARNLPGPVAVLADLPGPKLRVLLDNPLTLSPGQEVALALNGDVSADMGLTEPEALRGIQPDQRLLLDDGRLQLRVLEVQPGRLVLRVEVGGVLLPNKGINLPDTRLNLPAVTGRDREALAQAASSGVDWLALSFVRDAASAQELRAAARAHGLRLPLLAKIERPEAVQQAEAIIEAFDGIMVARGDLGVELALEQVPHIQKRLVNLARGAGKPVITATDMLDSMRNNPRPTRAEASDVANAVYDGTDAVMLSGETSVGQFPWEAFQTMDAIVRETEAHAGVDTGSDIPLPEKTLMDHITSLACSLAGDIQADAIVAPAFSGRTVRLLARHRPGVPIVVPVLQEAVYRQLALVWGLRPVRYTSGGPKTQDRLEEVVQAAFQAGAVAQGHRVVVMAGHLLEGGERFPTIRVVRVGHAGRSCEP